jgi:putative hemolysin
VLVSLAFLLGLVLLNGLLAMSEIAILGARRVRLKALADQGQAGAARALALAADPSRLLSTIQVGITSIGVLSGAIGEAAFAIRLEPGLAKVPAVGAYARPLSMALMVLGVTYVSIVLGELVPKRLALLGPDRIARLVAPSLHWLSVVTQPVVRILSMSTDGILAMVRGRATPEPTFSADDIRGLIEQGTAEGVLRGPEGDVLANVLDMGERSVRRIMTPRSEIAYLELGDPVERARAVLAQTPHTVLPVCDGGLDHVVGVVRAADMIGPLLQGRTVVLGQLMTEPVMVLETLPLTRVLERLRLAQLPAALVVDEYGQVEGLVSVSDLVGAVMGGLPAEPDDEPPIVRRADGSLLVDGRLAIDALEHELQVPTLEPPGLGVFHTVGGLVLIGIGHIPCIGETFEVSGFRFEVVDMDRHRVDRVLVSRVAEPPGRDTPLTKASP